MQIHKVYEAYQHAAQVEDKLLKQLEDLTKEMSKVSTRMDTVGKELRDYRSQRGSNDRRWDRNRQNIADHKMESADGKDLNRKGPSPQGQ